ncbi:Regulator of chromosome condensation (RCC1) repeat [Actinobacteria bacterium IMCC26256]|nr:Regulator of chromosome condensation (RCC1) repeat [Actinobacteria bacterium IMCC26256]
MSTSSFESSGEKKPAERASSRRAKRWIAVAAAVVVVAGGATAIAASQGGDSQRSGTVISDTIGNAVATKIGAGGGFSCAVTSIGRAKCWGANSYGQVGNATTSINGTSGSNTTSASEVLWGNAPYGPLQPVTAIAAGQNHACAIAGTGGFVLCWGSNSNGQLGNRSTTNSSIAVDVIDTANYRLSGVVGITAGNAQTCALDRQGYVYCWGSGVALNYSTNQTAAIRLLAVGSTTAPFKAKAVSAGGTATCLIAGALEDTSGTVMCLGSGGASLPGTLQAKAISVGGEHGCAVLPDGSVRCWGSNTYGQLGNGTKVASVGAAVVASGITNAVDVAAGMNHTCALLSDQTIKCWGNYSSGQTGQTPGENQYGQLIGSQTTPTPLAGITAVTAISSSSSSLHTCAIGSVANVVGMKCWGGNANYQIYWSATPYYTTPNSVLY